MEWRAILNDAGIFGFSAAETLCHLTFVPVTKFLIFDSSTGSRLSYHGRWLEGLPAGSSIEMESGNADCDA